jgi:hypothetical protein
MLVIKITFLLKKYSNKSSNIKNLLANFKITH